MRNYKHNKNGYILITIAVLFAALGLVLVLGGAVPVVSHYSSIQGYAYSKQALLASNSGINEAIYRLKTGKNLPISMVVSLNTGSSTITTTATPGGKQVAVEGVQKSYERNFQASLQYANGIAFNYGLQAGVGGMTMGGGSTINGNVYSNGDVDAISATINGSAVAADGSQMTIDQVNNTPSTPTNSIKFRDISSVRDFAQSFQPATSSVLNKISIYIKKVGTPPDGTIRLVTDNGGSPSTTQIPIGTLPLDVSMITANYSWVDLAFPTPPTLTPGTTYWLVLDNGSQSSSNYFVVAANNSYSSGTAKIGSYGGSWIATNLDGYFMTYNGGVTGLIGGASYVGGLALQDDGWATTIKGTSVQNTGILYCSVGTNNSKVCDTSRNSPPQIPLPFTDDNIQDWKNEAVGGGVYTGNYSVDWRGATLGPKKITGNLLVNGGGTLTLNGTLWVQGTVTVTGGGKVVLPANFGQNSGVIISDSYITVSGGGSAGSGNSASYLFFVSTSKCPNDTYCSGNSAININGGAGAIAANAQSGNVALSGGANIRAVVGNSITVSGGSVVNYDSGLASPSFVSGPSGGFSITSWKEN